MAISLPTDITVKKVRFEFQDVGLRSPLKFGTGTITELTYALATARVITRGGERAVGRGGILLSDLWAYPTKSLSHARRDRAMRAACGEIADLYRDARGHPIDIVMERKPDYRRIGREISRRLDLIDPLPPLALLVCASPVDAALHDAFGRANGVDSYRACGEDFWENDLSRYLGPQFRGIRPDSFLSSDFAPSLPVVHLVGGADALTPAEVPHTDKNVDFPRCLEEWIRRDGVYCFKVKLSGVDTDEDVERTGQVARVAGRVLEQQGRKTYHITVDANEMCPSPAGVVEYLGKLREKYPGAYDALLYLEQPTARDLEQDRFDMREVAARKPVLADEGITGPADMELARELGWSGVALKTCKGHTSALLCLALARRWGMDYSVQDLTNPGISLAHSAGLAGRISPILGVEANARQFLADPARELSGRHPGLFRIRNGRIDLGSLAPPGLGYGPPKSS